MHSSDSTDSLTAINKREIEALCDRLYSRGISAISAAGPRDRSDMILASRIMRALLARIDRDTGRQLAVIMIAGNGHAGAR